MFDLNVNIEANTNTSVAHNDKERNVNEEENQEASGTNTELSGTSSSSSVVNAAADDSSAAAGELNFFRAGEFVTRQLFPMSEEPDPVASEEGERELELFRVGSSQPTSTTHHQWLNLAVSGSGTGPGSGSGPGFAPEQQQQGSKQQVRRSRRGPRSRSSQYRGVTFYRRTGRWESHIW